MIQEEVRERSSGHVPSPKIKRHADLADTFGGLKMKETRLFEVGFKDKPHSTGYIEKFYVAADGGEEAIQIAREWVREDFLQWWNEDDGKNESLWRMAGKDFEKLGLDDSEFDSWCESHRSDYEVSLAMELETELKRVASYLLARVHDTGTVIV
jgi:hypothetical protein